MTCLTALRRVALSLAAGLLAPLALHAADDPAPATAMPRLFVLLDVAMETSALVEAKLPPDALLQRAFDGLGPRLKAWGARQGVQVELALFAERKKIDLAGRRHDYLLVEKIVQEARADTPKGARFSDRKWSAQAFDLRDDAAKAPRKLGSEDYVSDGLACFDSAAAPADRACQDAYMQRLSTHLRWIDPSWSPIDAGPR